MASFVSATDLAIAIAITDGSLAVVEYVGRFGPYWSIEDHAGVIEVALSTAEAQTRVGSIRQALAKREG